VWVVILFVGVLITQKYKGELERPFTREEVVEALNMMHPTKALGIDDTSTHLYHQLWEVVGNEVTNFVLRVEVNYLYHFS